MQRLIELLASYENIALGFSGGVDSTFLAAACARALPPNNVHLIHLDTPLVGTPERGSFERERERFASMGIAVVGIKDNPLEDPDVATNPANRCYHCKRRGFQKIVEVARELGASVILEGSNADDEGDYRPGIRAVRELDVRSPLMETGWHKEEERAVLRAWGHEVWDLPAGACLATRVPCGQRITAEKLDVIRSCEDHLHGLGFGQVRVRLDRGVAHVSLEAGELESPLLEKTSTSIGAAPHSPASPKAGERVLPQPIIAELEKRGAPKVDPVVRPYLHGEGNGRN